MNIFLKTYDFFQRRRRLCFLLLFALIGLSVFLTARLDYQEDIYDFLPFDANHRKELAAYQKISQADRIVVVFEMRDTAAVDADLLSEAIDIFGETAARMDTLHHFRDLTTTIDYGELFAKRDFIYANIPYFLTIGDYDRLDSLLTPEYVRRQIEQDKTMLLFPTGGILSDNIQRDPLNIFTPTVSRLQTANPSLQFELSDGHVFSEDSRRAYAFLTTPYGASETSHNKELSEQLSDVLASVEAQLPQVKTHAVGAPVIAVGNATQIKQDSLLAVAIAITLILALLLYSFRSLKNLLYISVSILAGWLFAMACLSLVHDSVSIIVLGIASVIIGIAVNYPLHLVAHLKHQPDVRQAIKEIVAPLVIGNITTVGAFLCLVPLDSAAMRDLGLFGSFMLVGTILFVIIFLPHLFRQAGSAKAHGQRDLFSRMADFSLEGKWVVIPVTLLTLVFAWFSLDISFDADVSNINYMTAEQRRDLNEVQGKMASATTLPVYVLSEDTAWDAAVARSEKAQQVLDRYVRGSLAADSIEKHSATAFIPSRAEQQRRLERWQRLIRDKGDLLTTLFDRELAAAGFDPASFEEYHAILSATYDGPLPDSLLQQFAAQVFPTNVCRDSLTTTIVDVLSVPIGRKDEIVAALNAALPESHAFDVRDMNSAMANTLSDDFNYIGYSCAFIVFFFLWLSFGSIELAALAFMPMAVSWIWILGIMQLCGIQFNIVSVILATFIFGQGDDYTIFMTEGLIYEHAYRRKMLASYKNSIILSALIMFIGVGSLIVAKHPALLSLGEVTVVGMFTVVLMAWLVPPLLFGWLVRTGGRPRLVPVTFRQLALTALAAVVYISELIYGNIVGLAITLMPCSRARREAWIHKLIWQIAQTSIKATPGIKTTILNPHGEDFSRGSIIICNHSSILDPVCLLGLSPRVVMLMAHHVWSNPVVHSMFRLARFNDISKPMEELEDYVAEAVRDGYSVVIFPEGRRSDEGDMQRFHRGAFYLAQKTGADLLPLVIHGFGHVMPKGSAFSSRGSLTIEIGERIRLEQLASYGGNHNLMAHDMRQLLMRRYEDLRRRTEDSHYFHHYIINRYLYKGITIERETRRLLKRHNDFCEWIDAYKPAQGVADGPRQSVAADPVQSNAIASGQGGAAADAPDAPDIPDTVCVLNAGRGQFPLLFAMVHRATTVKAYVLDADDAALISAITPLPANLQVVLRDSMEQCVAETSAANSSACYVLSQEGKVTRKW